MSNSLQCHGLQHAKLPCSSLYPRVCSTYVHWVSGAISLSHPLPPSSPLPFKLSHHQGLFQWVSSSNQVAKVLELQHQSFQWIVRRDFLSVQFSRSVMSDSLRPHESQHTRPPCPSPTPGVHSDSRPSSPWCHPAISSSVVPFSSCPQSLPASESFPMSQLFTWGGQSTGVSALASFLPN